MKRLRVYGCAGMMRLVNWIPTPAEQAEQQRQRVAELGAILGRYREKFGELSD